MSTAAVRGVVRQLGLADDTAPPNDAALLTRYARHRDSAAFAELLRRHGPLVLGTCRRILSRREDAEDAFQAVFLVLAMKADAVRPAGRVGSWLHGVAVRVASKAKVAAARRWRREMASILANPERRQGRSSDTAERAELRSIIDAELSRLPEKFRFPIVLCDLGGKTRGEAASELGCPEGTIAARLHQARKLLCERLTRRGVTLPSAGLGALLGSESVAADLGARTLAAAEAFASGAASPAIPPTVLTLAQGMLRTMTAGKIKIMLLVLGGMLLAGGGLIWASNSPDAAAPAAVATGSSESAAPAPANGNAPWRETKVLEQDGWLAGSVAYSPDGKTLVVGGTDGQGHVRAYSTDELKQQWDARVDGRFAAVAIALDGKTLAATGKDGVQLLDPATGKAGNKLEETGYNPLAVAWFPESGLLEAEIGTKKLIFGEGRGYFVKSWAVWPKVSTMSARLLDPGQKPVDGYAVPLAVAPSGKWAVTTGLLNRENAHRVPWAWATGSGAGNEVLEGHKATVVSAAWSRDGGTIMTGDADGVVITLEAATFKERSRLKLGGRVAALAISPDEKHIAAAIVKPVPGAGDGAYAEEVYIWQRSNLPQGKIIRRLPNNIVEIDLGSDAAVQPGATFMLLPSDFPGKGRRYRMKSFRMLDEKGVFRTVEKFVPKARIEVAEVLGPNRSRARITYEYDDIRERVVTGDLLYLVDEPAEKPTLISSHRAGGPFAGVASLAFSPDSKSLASAFCNFTHLSRLGELIGKVRIFSLSEKPKEPGANAGPWKKKEVLKVGEQGVESVYSLKFSPDGKRWAIGSMRGSMLLVDTSARFPDSILFTTISNDPHPADVAFSSDGRQLACTDLRGVEIKDSKSWKTLRLFQEGNVKALAVAFGPTKNVQGIALNHLAFTNGKTLWAKTWLDGGQPGTAQFGPLKDAPKIDGMPPAGVAYSPDGEQLVFIPNAKIDPEYLKSKNTGIPDPKKATHWYAMVWGGGSGKPMRILPHGTEMVTAVAWSPDGKLIATGGADGSVLIWDAEKATVLHRLGTAKNRVYSLAFSPDSKTLAAAGGGGTATGRVTLIDTARGVQVQTLRGFPDFPAVAVAFSPDGKTLIVGTGDPDARNRRLTKEEVKKSAVHVFDLSPPAPAPGASPVSTTAPVPPEKPIPKELQPFQGLWKVDLCDSVNEKLGASQKEAWKWRWTVKDNEITWGRQGEEWKLILKVDPSRKPKEIDLIYISGPFKGETCRGMYEWGRTDGKSLLISIQDPGAKVPRPKAIEMSSTSQTSLIFLRPAEPVDPKKELAALRGTWTFAMAQTDAWPKPIGKGPDKTGQGSERRWVIRGNEITWTDTDGKQVKVSFSIDPDKVPRQIDFTFLTGPHKGAKCKGVYEWRETGGLWLCLADPGMNGDRPKDISYSTGEGRSMISLVTYEAPRGKDRPPAPPAAEREP